MSDLKKVIVNFSKEYHALLHIAFGLSTLVIGQFYFGEITGGMVFTALVGSYLTDLDHLLYIYGYGSKSQFSQKFRAYVSESNLRKAVRLSMENHKDNTGIYSHNIVTLFIVLALGYYSLSTSNPSATVFWFAWSTHYIYDIVEDYLYFGKLNPNWFLQFNKKEAELFTE